MPNGSERDVATVSPFELRELLNDGGEIAVLDAREEASFAEAHLLLATCLPLSRLELDAERLLPRRDLRVVWCDDGEGLAQRAAVRLLDFGYRQVLMLAGGVSAWRDSGLPVYSGVHVPSKAFAEVVEHACGTPWISAEELNRRLAGEGEVAVFDSRSFEEFHANSIPTATSAPGAELVYRVGGLVTSPDTLVVVNCGGRTRSIVGAQALISAGLPNRVVSLKDGTMGWHLAGLPVERGSRRRAPDPGAEAGAKAAAAAERLARRIGVRTIDAGTLRQWRDERDLRSLYVLDVRSPEEYLAGHMPGAVGVAGGQLVQETENWIAALNARVVLVDDPLLARARITAVWLRQMGWKDVAVLPWRAEESGIETGAHRSEPLGWAALGASAAAPIEAAELHGLGDRGAVVIDVSSSKRHRAGHVPGAWFAVRARLLQRLDRLPPATVFVVTSEDGRLARYAAAELAAATTTPVRWLDGGAEAWSAAGLPLEQGLERLADVADDVWYAPRDRQANREESMRAYLEWEVALADEVGRDPDCRFEILL